MQPQMDTDTQLEVPVEHVQPVVESVIDNVEPTITKGGKNYVTLGTLNVAAARRSRGNP